MNTDIYKMKLHECMIGIQDGSVFTSVLRVPGGWLYISVDKGHNIGTQTFVPLNNEFQYNESQNLT
jgi:hypothetical protein